MMRNGPNDNDNTDLWLQDLWNLLSERGGERSGLGADPDQEHEPITERHEGFAITEESLGADLNVIALHGEIDLVTAPLFVERLDMAMERGRTKVVVDLSTVTFIDSSMINAIFTGLGRLRRRGGHLVLVCSAPAVLRVFTITGLDGLLDIYPERDDAVGALTPG
jgi:anti-sigma B factor antagonist